MTFVFNKINYFYFSTFEYNNVGLFLCMLTFSFGNFLLKSLELNEERKLINFENEFFINYLKLSSEILKKIDNENI